MFAITQAECYSTLLKYIGLCLGITVGTIGFFALFITVFAVARYHK